LYRRLIFSINYFHKTAANYFNLIDPQLYTKPTQKVPYPMAVKSQF